MFQVLADTHIPFLEQYFPEKYFKLHFYQNLAELKAAIKNKDILICRSIYQINEDVLAHSSIKLVASATSGVNHIDNNFLKAQNIKLLDAKGGNAPAVVDYVLASLASLERHFQFHAKKIAIIGYGHVGKALAKQLEILGYQIAIYDPLIEQESIPEQHRLKDLALKEFDVISLHANYQHDEPFPSKNLINENLKHVFSEHSCIINAARGHIVDETFIMSDAYRGLYCTDVYANEPHLNHAILKRASLATPHIAGHSIESKLRMTKMISDKIHQYLKLPILSPNLDLSKRIHINVKNWQESILLNYDPYFETQTLKEQGETAFFKLRHAHRRHEFVW